MYCKSSSQFFSTNIESIFAYGVTVWKITKMACYRTVSELGLFVSYYEITGPFDVLA